MMAITSHSLWDFRSLRFRLIAAVNGVLFVAVAVYLYFDYTRVLDEQITERRVSLEEEAKTLLPGISHLKEGEHGSVQSYIDDVCGRMSTGDSPGHHIIVEMGETTLQARSHHRQSEKMLDSVRRAATRPDRRFQEDGFDLVVGWAQEGNRRVLVSENVADIRRKAWRDELRRIQAVALLVLIEAATINFVLVRMVSRPLERLIARLRDVANQDFDGATPRFSNTELDTLAREIDHMSQALARLEQQRRAQLKKAHAIQQGLLPRHLDQVEGLEIGHLYQAAEAVGGDYFDLFTTEPDVHLISIGDATGHGVPAAMNAAMLKVLLQIASEQTDSPAKILNWVNQRFVQVQLNGDFATLIVIRIDRRQRTLHYANAGHDPVWLMQSDRTTELLATGPPLGIGTEFEWHEREFPFETNSRLAMSTDGIVETPGPNDELFGRDALLRILLDCRNRPPKETVDAVCEKVQKFRASPILHDDLTLVVVDIVDAQTSNLD